MLPVTTLAVGSSDRDGVCVSVCVCVCVCSVHSQQKHQIALRLVLGAQNVAYQQKDVSFEGPWPTGYMISLSASTMTLSFDSSDLYVHDQHGYIGFEVRRYLY